MAAAVTEDEDKWLYEAGDGDKDDKVSKEDEAKKSKEAMTTNESKSEETEKSTSAESDNKEKNKDEEGSGDGDDTAGKTIKQEGDEEEGENKKRDENIPSPEDGECEEESEEDDDVEVTIDSLQPDANGTSNLTSSTGQRFYQRNGSTSTTTKTNQKGLDIDTLGNINGQAAMDFNLDMMDDKPWRQPGADISDYFNYGLNETTWKAYCEKQKKTRIDYPSSSIVNNLGNGLLPAPITNGKGLLASLPKFGGTNRPTLSTVQTAGTSPTFEPSVQHQISTLSNSFSRKSGDGLVQQPPPSLRAPPLSQPPMFNPNIPPPRLQFDPTKPPPAIPLGLPLVPPGTSTSDLLLPPGTSPSDILQQLPPNLRANPPPFPPNFPPHMNPTDHQIQQAALFGQVGQSVDGSSEFGGNDLNKDNRTRRSEERFGTNGDDGNRYDHRGSYRRGGDYHHRSRIDRDHNERSRDRTRDYDRERRDRDRDRDRERRSRREESPATSSRRDRSPGGSRRERTSRDRGSRRKRDGGDDDGEKHSSKHRKSAKRRKRSRDRESGNDQQQQGGSGDEKSIKQEDDK